MTFPRFKPEEKTLADFKKLAEHYQRLSDIEKEKQVSKSFSRFIEKGQLSKALARALKDKKEHQIIEYLKKLNILLPLMIENQDSGAVVFIMRETMLYRALVREEDIPMIEAMCKTARASLPNFIPEDQNKIRIEIDKNFSPIISSHEIAEAAYVQRDTNNHLIAMLFSCLACDLCAPDYSNKSREHSKIANEVYLKFTAHNPPNNNRYIAETAMFCLDTLLAENPYSLKDIREKYQVADPFLIILLSFCEIESELKVKKTIHQDKFYIARESIKFAMACVLKSAAFDERVRQAKKIVGSQNAPVVSLAKSGLFASFEEKKSDIANSVRARANSF